MLLQRTHAQCKCKWNHTIFIKFEILMKRQVKNRKIKWSKMIAIIIVSVTMGTTLLVRMYPLFLSISIQHFFCVRKRWFFWLKFFENWRTFHWFILPNIVVKKAKENNARLFTSWSLEELALNSVLKKFAFFVKPYVSNWIVYCRIVAVYLRGIFLFSKWPLIDSIKTNQ